MSVNKFQPHVYVIPEDRADEEIANGFVLHDQVQQRQIQVLPCANGWPGVLAKLKIEYLPHLRGFKQGNLVLLIDYDGKYEKRRKQFDDEVPDELKERVFVLGAKETPEQLKSKLKMNFEAIGQALADDCFYNRTSLWDHEQLKHNDPDRGRLFTSVRKIMFGE